jgi:hypothetical protein
MSLESAPCEILTLISRKFAHTDFANFALSCTHIYDNIYYQRSNYIKHRSKFTSTLKTIRRCKTLVLHKHHNNKKIIISIHDCVHRRVYLCTNNKLICYSRDGTHAIECVNLNHTDISTPYIILGILYYVTDRDSLANLVKGINDYLQ